jgi:SNF2 family DNA or RNA helicase
LTGKPLDGLLEEINRVMEWVMPGLLESKTRFIQKYATTDIWGKVTGYKNIQEVTAKIAPYFIRRLKKDVLQDLPDKIYQNRIVVLTDKEKRIYKALAEAGHEATEDALAVTCVLRCKQFCDYPELVGETMKGSKYEELRRVLQEVVVENCNKALIFTQYKEMLNFIVVLLDEMGIKYLRIDGDTPKQDRADYQKTFNTDPAIDMMVGTEAMSTGLNFTGGSYVINYDDNWSPAFMAQREDRCHRIGQKDVVTVINFVCKDTIEERIRDVLYGKNVVSSLALGDDVSDTVLRRITPKEQAKLL